jgi:hypothetical protein
MMRKNKLKYLIGFVLILILGSTCNLIINRNFLCSHYEDSCCHDGKIEWLDKYFCKIHFKQIEYILVFFPNTSARCWKAEASYLDREYSGKENTQATNAEDKKKTLYYLDQAVKYNPEDIDVLSWRENFGIDCKERIKYAKKIISVFNNSSSHVILNIHGQLIANIYYDLVGCMRELHSSEEELWQRNFNTFCSTASDKGVSSVCETLLSSLKEKNEKK